MIFQRSSVQEFLGGTIQDDPSMYMFIAVLAIFSEQQVKANDKRRQETFSSMIKHRQKTIGIYRDVEMGLVESGSIWGIPFLIASLCGRMFQMSV